MVRCRRGPALEVDREGTSFALHVFRDVLRVRITFQMTVSSPPALASSKDSSRSSGLT